MSNAMKKPDNSNGLQLFGLSNPSISHGLSLTCSAIRQEYVANLNPKTLFSTHIFQGHSPQETIPWRPQQGGIPDKARSIHQKLVSWEKEEQSRKQELNTPRKRRWFVLKREPPALFYFDNDSVRIEEEVSA